MKRFFLALGLVAIALAAFWAVLRRDPAVPRFVRFHNPPAVGAIDLLHFPFLASEPFPNGKGWVQFRSAEASNQFRTFLLDIDQRAPVGELLNATALFMTSDESHLLCVRRTSPTNSLRERIARSIERATRSRITFRRLPPIQEDEEHLWVVDLRRGSAKRIGTIPQGRGLGSVSIPSADGRFGYKTSFAMNPQPSHSVYLADLGNQSLERLTVSGWPVTWWDRQNTVFKALNGDLVLFDIMTKQARPLLSEMDLDAFLRSNNIEAEVTQVGVPSWWRRRERELFITDMQRGRSLEGPAFLAKISGGEPKLSLVSRTFEIEHLGDLDASASYYVYSPREVDNCCNGVTLRDLRANTNRVLVRASSSQAGTAFPRFYRDTVIYVRTNALWQVDLHGLNHVRLFPPPPGAGNRGR